MSTPASPYVNGRRTDVHKLGTYWGGMGEQIDLRSGHLNYSVPPLTAQGRSGLSLPLALVYDSQLWRKENAQVWQLGADTGYGFGWRMLPGASLLPRYGTGGQLHHYLLTDAGGGEYRLFWDANLQVYTSRDGAYASFEPEPWVRVQRSSEPA